MESGGVFVAMKTSGVESMIALPGCGPSDTLCE